jgi:hypothetical protein
MKKFILWAGLALGLGACGNVETSNLRITGEYGAVINGTEQDVICNNKPSFVTYSFDYTGDLGSWTSSLEGVTTGQVSNTKEYTVLGTPPVNGNVTARYDVLPKTAPLSLPTGSKLSAQGIIVVPSAKVIGYTRVKITAFDFNGFATFTKRSNSLPVVDNC